MATETTYELLHYIKVIQPTDGAAVDKVCLLTTSMVTNQKKDNIFDENAFSSFFDWLETALRNRHSVNNVLLALKRLFKVHTNFIEKYLDTLLNQRESVVLQYLDELLIEEKADVIEGIIPVVELIDVLLSNALMKQFLNGLEAPSTENVYEKVADYILRIHFTKNNYLQKSQYFQLLPIQTFPLLSKICALFPAYARAHIGELLGLVKAYIHFDLPGSKIINVQNLHTSQQSVYSPLEEESCCQENAGGKISKTRKPRAMTKNSRTVELKDNLLQRFESNTTNDFTSIYNPFDYKTSDSDSEPEGNRSIPRYSKIRLSALSMLGLLVKVLDRSVFYGYWCAFFPNNVSCKDGILNVAVRDPNVTCRLTALQVASQMIFGAKHFLEQAESGDQTPVAYLPFSLSLGQMIHTMYDVLVQSVANESSIPVLTHTLKCLAVLVQSTSFHRLRLGLVHSFVKHIRKLVYHKDASVQVSALMIMEFLISTPKITKEISEIIGIPNSQYKSNVNQNRLNDSIVTDAVQEECFDEFIDSEEEENADVPQSSTMNKSRQTIKSDMTWLLRVVLHNLSNKNKEVKVPAAVKIESLQVITSMSLHFTVLIFNLEAVATTLTKSICDSLPEVRLYTSRCLDSIGYNMNKYLISESRTIEELLLCQQFWTNMLPIAMQKIGEKDQINTIKMSLCDFLSNIGFITFNRLPHNIQMNLLSFLSGIGSDIEEDALVRSAAVRALAVFTLFPSLRQNLVFVENTAELTIPLASDPNLNVRIKALWSIGNVSDALISNCEPVYNERISKELLNRLINISADSCNDNDKVRCNAVRALGNLLRLLTKEMLSELCYRNMFQTVVMKLIDCIKTSGNAKVKWNTCYAIGCLVKNNSLFEATSLYKDLTWHKAMFPALCQLIVHHSNFKVRINAAVILTNIQERPFFSEYFNLCWCSLLSALEKSNVLANFREYNHRDSLQERICIALCHITRLATNDDCILLRMELVQKIEIVRETWFRVINRMTPEDAAPLLSCPVLLKERIKPCKLMTVEQRNAILLIANCFSNSE